jgi:hypothetical protein
MITSLYAAHTEPNDLLTFAAVTNTLAQRAESAIWVQLGGPEAMCPVTFRGYLRCSCDSQDNGRWQGLPDAPSRHAATVGGIWHNTQNRTGTR